MLCAAVDIGSNTTRVLVAEPQEGQLRKVMEQRAYTRFGKDSKRKGKITAEKIAELAEVVTTQVRLAEELGAEAIRIVATAAIREAKNADEAAKRIAEAAGVPVEVLSARRRRAGSRSSARRRPSAIPVEGEIGVVDVGGGSSEIILGTVSGGVREVRSFKIGSGAVAEEFLTNDPPVGGRDARRCATTSTTSSTGSRSISRPRRSPSAAARPRCGRWSGRCSSTRPWSARCGCSPATPIAEVAKRFELDPRRVRILPAGVLILEKLSELLGQPLQIGKGGLREGVILDLLQRRLQRRAGGARGVGRCATASALPPAALG